MSISDKQATFIKRYLDAGNATQAYLDAGYKDRGTAAKNSAAANRLVKMKHIRELVDARTAHNQQDCMLHLETRLKMMRECYDAAMEKIYDKQGNAVKADLSQAVAIVKELNRIAELGSNKQQDDGVPRVILKNYADVHLTTDRDEYTVDNEF